MQTDHAGNDSGPRSPERHHVLRLIDDPVSDEPGHSHVVAAETQDGDAAPRRWRLVEIVEAVRLGERFVLVTGAELEPTVCDRCARVTVAAIGG
jgi:hypothetical protein